MALVFILPLLPILLLLIGVAYKAYTHNGSTEYNYKPGELWHPPKNWIFNKHPENRKENGEKDKLSS